MPLKLNITSSRKIGQPNYGSRGAMVGLEMEVDTNLLDHPRQLHHRIARLFRLAQNSVDRELASGQRTASPLGHGQEDLTEPIRSATDRQIRALHAIANRREIDLQAELQHRLGVARPEDLSLDEASDLITALGANNSQLASRDEMVAQVPPDAST